MDENWRYIKVIKIQTINSFTKIGATESAENNRNSLFNNETIAISWSEYMCKKLYP